MTHTFTEAVRAFGLSPRALRLYDDLGIVRAGRNRANRRVYEPDQWRELGMVAELRKAGVSLEDLRSILETFRVQGEPAAAQLALQHVRAEVGRLRREIADAYGVARRLRVALQP